MLTIMVKANDIYTSTTKMVDLKIALTFLMGLQSMKPTFHSLSYFTEISALFSSFLKTAPASTMVFLHSLWLAGKAEGLLESQMKLAITFNYEFFRNNHRRAFFLTNAIYCYIF